MHGDACHGLTTSHMGSHGSRPRTGAAEVVTFAAAEVRGSSALASGAADGLAVRINGRR